ncbi:FAD-binding oxidoreductase [Nocardia sp. NPDC049526]|uniref:FAD-binding oxidoreductase n=1 Tax=Nocardia sp. NPDC049526 TaxID=3364316 RepID=UPI00379286D9
MTALTERIDARAAVLELYTVDETGHTGHRPLGVVHATSLDDVLATVEWARHTRTPIIARGAGTSLEGHLLSRGDEVVLDLSGLDAILDISPTDFTATVQPGVTRTRLNAAAAEFGLQFTVDPGADASLGGMAATNASGTTSVRYGGMRANVLAMQVVFADDTVARLGRPVRKSSSGYDLKDLLIGSAGTLGIITELTVRLHPIPEWLRSLRISFPSVERAVAAAVQMLGSALPLSRLELIDAPSMAAINAYRGTRYPVGPTLLIDIAATSAAAAASDQNGICELAADNGAVETVVAQSHTARHELWEDRHTLFFALKARHPGHQFLVTDTAVPYSRIADAVAKAEELAAQLGLDVAIAGHIGDGNVHVAVPYTDDTLERARRFSDQVVRQALSLGGTASGEHGIGLAKKQYLRAEHGSAVEVMAAVKRALDPLGLLNPGKILD